MKRAFCIVAMLLLLQAQALGETNFRQAQAIGTVSFSADGLIEQLAIEEDDAILMWLLGL